MIPDAELLFEAAETTTESLPNALFGSCEPAGVLPPNLNLPGMLWLDDAREEAGGPAEAGWSYVGFSPSLYLNYESGAWNLYRRERDGACAGEAGVRRELFSKESPFSFLTSLFPASSRHGKASPAEIKESGPPFRGGWAACFSYDLGREIERLPASAVEDLDVPLVSLGFYDVILAYDHRERRWWGTATATANTPKRSRKEQLRKKIMRATETLRAAWSGDGRPARGTEKTPPRSVVSNFSPEEYRRAVGRILAYIAAGDCCQVNLSQRFSAPWTAGGGALYRALRAESPARYGVFWRPESWPAGNALAGISPELFLRVRGAEAATKPIKGTRRRGRTPAEDAQLAAELTAAEKDAAELAMIVDLERNDLGRVCEYGSVRVVSPGKLETLPTVHHRTAEVVGTLCPDRGPAELLRAAFPGGSITGAPKIRAQEIIEELEPTRRGPYCGAVGWLAPDGDWELNLAIRTAFLDGRAETVHYHAGGGVVADSVPAAEYEETLHKATAFFRAVNGAPPADK